MGIVIADPTWIVHCSLWSPTVEQFEDMLTQASAGLADEEFVKVSLTHLDVVVVTKTPKPVVKLQGSRQTSVKVTGKGVCRVVPDPPCKKQRHPPPRQAYILIVNSRWGPDQPLAVQGGRDVGHPGSILHTSHVEGADCPGSRQSQKSGEP